MGDSVEVEFEDYLPIMAEKLGNSGLMEELAKGFQLLADPSSLTITVHSLKTNGPALGLPKMSDEDLREIIRFGDSSGRGELDLHDFCVTMFRTSPALVNVGLFSLFEDDEKRLHSSRW
ncbi:hypothetical protein KP509_30G075500 [Ceratopteris richardii]|uniref:EF-hand domain-containing protein n=1 Tax=Ceratopteris richardii TaxID=49495 RepID=A0A8T2R5J9_CERRI|nr:hypothetical protein KP509_30G075500 [Ceratopteris richardii]